MITGEHTRITQLGFTQNMVLVKTCPDAQAPIDLLGSDPTSEHLVAISDFISKQTACDHE